MEVPKPLSLAELLIWEARQTTDHELIDGAIVAMPNGQVVTAWPDALLRLDSIGCKFSIEQLYEGLALSNEPI